jgi:NAD+ kinase
MVAVTTVGFVVHEGRAAAVEAADTLRAQLDAAGITCRDDVTAGVSLVVAVGGDGTFLRGAHAAAALGVPVLGVKVGRLGFLTEVEPGDAAALIARALAGEAPVEDRLAVVAEPVNGAAFDRQWGMNEIMIEKRARHRLVRLRVEFDGEYLTTFSADGVIVATPTGSTAYSFSARGPIVAPSVDVLVVTAVAPHMVFDRSFVLGPQQVVRLEVVGDEPGLLSADGRDAGGGGGGAAVRIRKADAPARFVRRPDAAPFIARVRDKFGLPGDPADHTG